MIVMSVLFLGILGILEARAPLPFPPLRNLTHPAPVPSDVKKCGRSLACSAGQPPRTRLSAKGRCERSTHDTSSARVCQRVC
jgi:hypothetical protein